MDVILEPLPVEQDPLRRRGDAIVAFVDSAKLSQHCVIVVRHSYINSSRRKEMDEKMLAEVEGSDTYNSVRIRKLIRGGPRALGTTASQAV